MRTRWARGDPDLRRKVREQSPSWLISLGIHALLLVILASIGWTVLSAPEPPVVIELGTVDERHGGL